MSILKNNLSLRRMRLMRRDFGTTCTQKGIAVRRSLSVRSCFGAWCTNSYTSEKTTSNGEFIRTDTRVTKSLVAAHYTQAQGRSMVEMLGVLAIIGILSVGAIAGYSKAMMKYKLNKQAEQISWLLNALYRHKDMLGHNSANFIPYFKKLGEIPQEMIKPSNRYIYDSFGLLYDITTDNCSDGFCYVSTLFIQSPTNYKNFDVCHNIFETSKAFSAQLYYFGSWSGEYGRLDYLYGDNYCSSARKCLKDLTKNDMYEICKKCAEKSCNFYFKYEIKA